jgi:hypothetical protein
LGNAERHWIAEGNPACPAKRTNKKAATAKRLQGLWVMQSGLDRRRQFSNVSSCKAALDRRRQSRHAPSNNAKRHWIAAGNPGMPLNIMQSGLDRRRQSRPISSKKLTKESDQSPKDQNLISSFWDTSLLSL